MRAAGPQHVGQGRRAAVVQLRGSQPETAQARRVERSTPAVRILLQRRIARADVVNLAVDEGAWHVTLPALESLENL